MVAHRLVEHDREHDDGNDDDDGWNDDGHDVSLMCAGGIPILFIHYFSVIVNSLSSILIYKSFLV